MTKTINAKVLHVVKTTAEWQAETTIISKGLLCIEITADGKTLAKVGDGEKTYTNLAYLSDGSFTIADYYTSDETDAAISNAISGLGTIFTFKGIKATIEELPTENKVGDVWFVGNAEETDDNFEEYMWTDSGKWEFLGERQVATDLSGYATVENLETHTNNKDNPHEVTKAQVGLGDVENKNSETIRSEITKENVTSALGYEPPETDTTYENATAENAGLMSAEDKTTLDTIAEDYIKSEDTLILTCTL